MKITLHNTVLCDGDLQAPWRVQNPWQAASGIMIFELASGERIELNRDDLRAITNATVDSLSYPPAEKA
jgi:hypothetical protein